MSSLCALCNSRYWHEIVVYVSYFLGCLHYMRIAIYAFKRDAFFHFLLAERELFFSHLFIHKWNAHRLQFLMLFSKFLSCRWF